MEEKKITLPKNWGQFPELPRVLKKREADVTPKVLAWFREKHKKIAVFEIKATDSNSIPQSALAPHQRAALIKASTGTLVHKLTDASRTRQPFDAFCVSLCPAYVVAVFPTHKVAYVITVGKWTGASYKMNDYEYKLTL